jgi:tetratricopeptide (TPR) repeat protein/predicted Ser/Thr protein kinase
MDDCIPLDALERLLRGELSEVEAAEVGTHLRSCDRCRSILDQATDHAALRLRLEAALRVEDPTLNNPVLCRLVDDLQATPPAGETSTWELTRDRPGADTRPPAPPGEPGRMGPYRLLEELGRGGMGIVYRAIDEPLGREVALKVLRPDQVEEADRHRLLREAQLASRFQNDHVVVIHAVVDPPGGLPYLAMEYVPGQTLAQWIASDSWPDPRQVATWIAEVAQALDAAHVAGLIHRDVKPGNILIDARNGRAKITDFGLARAQSGQSRITREGFLAGTPTYMSPEQARGDPALDPRSDIYSLGSTLYEALTGVTPYRGAPHLVLKQVIEDDPRPLRQLNDQVPQDLETICLKAMSREPSRRYPRAGELADDLRRWLRGEPILARPIGMVERSWRWCRRNPRVVGLSGSLVLVFLAGFLGVFWQWRRAEANATRAENQAIRAELMRQSAEANLKQAQSNFRRARRAVDQFYTSFYEKGVLEVPGLEKIRHEVVAAILDYYKEFLDQDQDDPALRRELAETCFRLGTATYSAGAVPDALALLRRALQDYEILERSSPTDLEIQAQVAQCLGMIALLEQRLGDLESARRTAQRGIGVLQGLVQRKPEDDRLRVQLAAQSGNLANIVGQLGDPAQSKNAYQRALEIQKVLVQRSPENLIYKNDLATTYNNLWMLQEALDLRKQLVEQAPTNPFFRRNLGRTYQNLGVTQAENGHWEDAFKSLEESCRLLQDVVYEQPSTTVYQRDLAQALYNWGDMLDDRRRYAAAKPIYQRSLVLYQKLHHADASDPSFQGMASKIEKRLAEVERHLESSPTNPREEDRNRKVAERPAGSRGP